MVGTITGKVEVHLSDMIDTGLILDWYLLRLVLIKDLAKEYVVGVLESTLVRVLHAKLAILQRLFHQLIEFFDHYFQS